MPAAADSGLPCPVCRHGTIRSLPLMDETWACFSCQHLFAVKGDAAMVRLLDAQGSLTWSWQARLGAWRRWQPQATALGWGYAIAGVLFALLPPLLVEMPAYWFPPRTGGWLPHFWALLTLLVHGGILAWLVLGYLQLPVGLYLQALWRQRSTGLRRQSQ